MKKLLALLPIFGLSCVFVFGVLLTSGCEKIEPTSKLDAYELHYDADGYFLLINDKDNLMGVYDGIAPLEHFYINLKCDEDYVLTTIEGLNQYPGGLTDEIEEYLNQNNIPYDTPVIILNI